MFLFPSSDEYQKLMGRNLERTKWAFIKVLLKKKKTNKTTKQEIYESSNVFLNTQEKQI